MKHETNISTIKQHPIKLLFFLII